MTLTGKITRACLKDKQVMQSMSNSINDEDWLQWKVQKANNLSVDALNQARFNGELLCATFEERNEEERLVMLLDIQLLGVSLLLGYVLDS